MRVSHLATFMTISLVALIPGTTDSAVTNAARPGVQKILFHGAEAARKLPAALVGQGVDGIASSAWTDSQGGRVTWSVIRDDTDHVGIRHVFYRQRYLPPSWVAEALEPKYAKNGIEVYGAEIGLHYWKTGDLEFVFGTQVPDLVVANDLAVTDRNQAYNMAQEEAAVQPDFHAADRATWSPDLVKGQIDSAELLLWNDGKTAEWRYAWRVPTRDSFGESYQVVMDAGTGEVLRLASDHPQSECYPSSNTLKNAKANPQNPYVSDRYVWASPASDRGPSFTHEAHRPASYHMPDIEVFHGVTSSSCASNSTYELLPLPTGANGQAYYDGLSTDPYPGSVGGDAIYFTYKTMQTFSMLGRNGWDGSGGPAKVVVDAYGWYNGRPLRDVAEFDRTAQDYAPANSVAIMQKLYRPYSVAAAMDIVAHEFGHGVIYTSANFPYTDIVGAQLHEGFGDVIGYITEQSNQPQGSGTEKADWMGGEDSGWADRRVDMDDGPGGYTLHRYDDYPQTTEAHARGNMLPVAFRLTDVGGQNPICSRSGWTTDCDISVNGQGLIKARSIFFDMLAYYCTSTTQWADLAEIGKAAAWGLYCDYVHPFASLPEQRAVNHAFGAIGYPGDENYEQCPTW